MNSVSKIVKHNKRPRYFRRLRAWEWCGKYP